MYPTYTAWITGAHVSKSCFTFYTLRVDHTRTSPMTKSKLHNCHIQKSCFSISYYEKYKENVDKVHLLLNPVTIYKSTVPEISTLSKTKSGVYKHILFFVVIFVTSLHMIVFGKFRYSLMNNFFSYCHTF